MSGKVQASLGNQTHLLRDVLTWPPFIVLALMYVPRVYGLEYAALPAPVRDAIWAGAAFMMVASFVAREMHRERLAMTSIYIVVALAVVLTINRVAYLIRLLHVGSGLNGWSLLETGLVVWSSNVLIFSLLYWALDGGGPADRNAASLSRDWLFPEMSINPKYKPNYVDYLCLAFNTSTAFSPTDVATLTTRARALMAVQSSISLATLAIVAARAVNILS
jgi:uncharacterized membrane protein